MPHIVLDFDPPQPRSPEFTSDTGDLVYFLSWAYSQRYGASHEASHAVLVLRGEYGVNMQPLLTFADREIEEPVDEETMERAWQDAAPLAESAAAVAEAMETGDARLASVMADFPNLQQNIMELAAIARWAAEHSARIRVTYEFE